MPEVHRRNNFIYFTLALLALLLSASLIDSLPNNRIELLLQGFVLLTLAVSYRSLDYGIVWRRFIAGLVALLFVSSVLEYTLLWPNSSILDLLVMLLFFISAAYRSSRQVLFSGYVDGNIIIGSIAIFLLLGLIWACLYLLVNELLGGAFNGMPARAWEDNFATATYFSYATLTTVGYGDISPAQPLSRVLVYLEAIAGVFYMAIVVASLVGARRSND